MRQESETTPGDAIAKFLELLRSCVYVVCKFLFNFIQIVLFGWLFVVGILLPWRLVPLLCCKQKSIFSCTDMSTFRNVAMRVSFCISQFWIVETWNCCSCSSPSFFLFIVSRHSSLPVHCSTSRPFLLQYLPLWPSHEQIVWCLLCLQHLSKTRKHQT